MSLLEDDPVDQVQIDPNIDYLAELTKPGAKFDRTKYQSEQELFKEIAKGKYHADMTVEVLKRDGALTRQDYLKEREQNVTRAQLEDVINQITNKTPMNSAIPPANDDKPLIDTKQIESLVSTKILEIEATRKEEANYNSVKAKLTEKYGTQYHATLARQMADLGLTANEIETMAKKQPLVFIKTFGLDQQQRRDSFEPPLRSTQGFAPTGGQKRNWAYYQEIRKSQPKVYYDPKTQSQMMADYASLGKDFEDDSFYQ